MARRKEIIKNICLTKEEANRIDNNAYAQGLSTSQYLADPSNIFYKLAPLFGNACIKLKNGNRIEYINDIYNVCRYCPDIARRLVKSIYGVQEESPYSQIDGMEPLRKVSLYIILEDENDQDT